MPEKLRNGFQIRTVFQQMRSKGMAKRVRRDILGDMGTLLIFFDDLPKTLTRQTRTVEIEKQGLLSVICNQDRPALLQIIRQTAHGSGIKRHNPVFGFGIAVAMNIAKIKIDILDI